MALKLADNEDSVEIHHHPHHHPHYQLMELTIAGNAILLQIRNRSLQDMKNIDVK